MPDAFALSMSAGLTSIATEMHAGRRAHVYRAAEAKRSKTFHDKYGDRIADGILLLTRAMANNFIPAYYQGGGGRQKGGSEHVILQREVDQSDESLGLLPFKVSPSQVISLKTFDFCGISVGVVGPGVLPFVIFPPDTTSISAVRVATRKHANDEIFDL
jgi:hypothetical protein